MIYSQYSHQEYDLKDTIQKSIKVIRSFQWLLDLYVLDFFANDHWNKLPLSWQNSFQDMDPSDLGKILLGIPTGHMLPLTFLALLETIRSLSISRKVIANIKTHPRNVDADKLSGNSTCSNPRLQNLFLKHVKIKKRHEIGLMTDIVDDVATRSNCKAVIDFGSGLGHLVRVLAYKHNIYAAGIECQSQLTTDASKLDQELEYTVKKYLTEESMSHLKPPLHFNIRLSSDDDLLNLPLPDSMSYHGLVGLHPCGDLGPFLLKHFASNKKVKFICIVGCCYMKLTEQGYPMSLYLKSLDNNLSYAMTEIACHAIEVYCERLIKGNYHDLKIHAFRAALERLLVTLDPKLRHLPVRSIKHTDSMNFQSYCTHALEKLQIPMPSSEAGLAQAEADLAQWRRVVIVYTIRLALAPLIETVVLLDRVLYVLEHGLSCEIRPVFDPKLSPRNHIIIGRRL